MSDLALLASRLTVSFGLIESSPDALRRAILDAAIDLVAARESFPSNTAFSVWLAENDLINLSGHDRAALIHIGHNFDAARPLILYDPALPQSPRYVWEAIRDRLGVNAKKEDIHVLPPNAAPAPEIFPETASAETGKKDHVEAMFLPPAPIKPGGNGRIVQSKVPVPQQGILTGWAGYGAETAAGQVRAVIGAAACINAVAMTDVADMLATGAFGPAMDGSPQGLTVYAFVSQVTKTTVMARGYHKFTIRKDCTAKDVRRLADILPEWAALRRAMIEGGVWNAPDAARTAFCAKWFAGRDKVGQAAKQAQLAETISTMNEAIAKAPAAKTDFQPNAVQQIVVHGEVIWSEGSKLDYLKAWLAFMFWRDVDGFLAHGLSDPAARGRHYMSMAQTARAVDGSFGAAFHAIGVAMMKSPGAGKLSSAAGKLIQVA